MLHLVDPSGGMNAAALPCTRPAHLKRCALVRFLMFPSSLPPATYGGPPEQRGSGATALKECASGAPAYRRAAVVLPSAAFVPDACPLESAVPWAMGTKKREPAERPSTPEKASNELVWRPSSGEGAATALRSLHRAERMKSAWREVRNVQKPEKDGGSGS
jgi:hypothetical protein